MAQMQPIATPFQPFTGFPQMPMPAMPADVEKVMNDSIEKYISKSMKNPSESFKKDFNDFMHKSIMEKDFLKKLHVELGKLDEEDGVEYEIVEDDEEKEKLEKELHEYKEKYHEVKHYEKLKDKFLELYSDDSKSVFELEESFFKEHSDFNDVEKRIFSCILRSNFPKMLNIEPVKFFEHLDNIAKKI